MLTRLMVLLGLIAVVSCVPKTVRNERYGFKTGSSRYLGSDKELALKNSAFTNPDPAEENAESNGEASQSKGGDTTGKGSDEQEQIEDDSTNSGNPNQSPNQSPGDDGDSGKGDDPETDTNTDTGTNTDSDTDTDTDSQTETDTDTTPPITPEDENPGCEDTTFSVSRLCSNKAASAAGKWRIHWGRTLAGHHNSYRIRVVKQGTSEVVKEWSDPAELKTQAESIFFQRKFTVNLGDVEDGSYDILLCANNSLGNCKAMYGRKIASGGFSKQGCAVTPGVVTVLVGRANPGNYNGQRIPCDSVASPLIIDLDNKGIELSSPDKGVNFDVDADGWQDQISWPFSGSVFLAIDLNGNGKIDSGAELFGNSSKLPDDSYPANGFEALRYYDGNKDGKVNEKDEMYDQLVVWADLNRDGISDEGEMKLLKSAGVKEIDLDYSVGLEADFYGNQTRERSVVTMRDGTKRLVVDIWFLPRK